MSKIQDALRRLQEAGRRRGASPQQYPPTPNSCVPPTAIQITQRKRNESASNRYNIDEEQLMRRGLLAPIGQAAAIADEFRRIKRPLIYNASKHLGRGEHNANVIVVTSALPGSGKTFCSVNLAASISLEREFKVLLVDADVTGPHMSTAFGLADQPGLIDILEDETLLAESVLVRTNLHDMKVLPIGRKHQQPTELLASERLDEVVHELATRYPDRLIIIDSPSLLKSNEAQVVARQAGQVVLVVESGKTLEREIREAKGLLDRKRPVTAILNKKPS